jgi:DNA-binding NarL/FixJ family response regulator
MGVQENPITVAIIEDHTLMREGLRWILRERREFRCVAEAGDGRAALDLVKRHKPDVLLLDMMLPTTDGLEVLRQVASETKVLAMSMRNDSGFVAEAFQGGARGYLVKEASSEELAKAVKAVAAGERYLSQGIDRNAVKAALRQKRQRGSGGLTRREDVMMRHCATGATIASIAAQLSISPRTVEMHRKNFMRKLGLRSQTDVVRYAIRNGLIPA